MQATHSGSKVVSRHLLHAKPRLTPLFGLLKGDSLGVLAPHGADDAQNGSRQWGRGRWKAPNTAPTLEGNYGLGVDAGVLQPLSGPLKGNPMTAVNS